VKPAWLQGSSLREEVDGDGECSLIGATRCVRGFHDVSHRLATILFARKSWIGLLIAIVNSVIVCAIALRTSQLGFIPANLFCICVYGLSSRNRRIQIVIGRGLSPVSTPAD
jgi:hypothetical protein